jgi:acylphosphatase
MKEEDRKDQSRVHLSIEGRVQGVFFRYSTVEEAVRLRLSGWVRNCSDGSVEVVAEGPKKVIEELIRWCHHGPPGAHVHNVRIKWEAYKGEFSTFHTRR